ncbi:MAG: zinc transporter [Rhodobacteraceae bacterium]|nr:zinc transporter [Paracoccaceae bacterium]
MPRSPSALLTLSLALTAAIPTLLRAEVPRVATDIAPVHALVSRVMEGTGRAPSLLLPPSASPHDYAMRPSEARSLSEADLVVWVGPVLTPWLGGSIDSLAPEAEVLTLAEVSGTLALPLREGALFGGHTHGAEEASEGMDEQHEEDGHEADGHEEDGHAGGDPHLWLDPRNAALWLGPIAEALAEQDPDNAALYLENARAGQAELAALEEEIAKTLAPARGKPFLVAHDAYHHFEARFDIEASGALADTEALAPGAARLTEVRDAVRDRGILCIFAEPQTDRCLLETATEGSKVRFGTLDPVGAGLEPGAGLYPALLRDMAAALKDCLAPGD